MKKKAAKRVKKTRKPEAGKFSMENHMLLKNWQRANKQLTKVKAEELRLRLEFVRLMSSPNKQKGTENILLPNGDTAKITKKLNYGWVKSKAPDADEYEPVETALKAIKEQGGGPLGELLVKRLVKWKPELSLTEYNQLPLEFKQYIDPVIVTTPATPTLEIVPPKEEEIEE